MQQRSTPDIYFEPSAAETLTPTSFFSAAEVTAQALALGIDDPGDTGPPTGPGNNNGNGNGNNP